MKSLTLTVDEVTNVSSQLTADVAAACSYDPDAGKLFYSDAVAATVEAADKTKFVRAVPATIRADQARVQLIALGQGGAVDTYISALQDPDKSVLQAVWDYRTEFARRDAQFLRLLGGVGIADIDGFFLGASQQ